LPVFAWCFHANSLSVKDFFAWDVVNSRVESKKSAKKREKEPILSELPRHVILRPNPARPKNLVLPQARLGFASGETGFFAPLRMTRLGHSA
jgi:hypothetical protein